MLFFNDPTEEEKKKREKRKKRKKKRKNGASQVEKEVSVGSGSRSTHVPKDRLPV